MPEITELDEFDPRKMSGVQSPANGTDWLLLKSTAHDGDTHSAEADAQEEEMTKACGQDSCMVCADALEKGVLRAKERNALPTDEFAYIDKKGGHHLPINDASHVRNALARFNQTHFESASAKRNAHKKIVARAHELGVDVSKSTGVPDESVATPTIGGANAKTGQSGVHGPATLGLATPPPDPADAKGGESTYVIAAESRANKVKNKKAPKRGPHSETMRKDTPVLQVIDEATKSNWLAVDNPILPPSPDESSDPGDSAWESYDADTLDSVARGLAGAARAVDAIGRRETIEAIAGDPNDWFDAASLGCAAQDIHHALGLVARLAYHEAAASTGAKKEVRQALAKALDELSKVLGDPQLAKTAGKPGTESEEEMNTVTQKELDSLLKKAAKKALKDPMRKIEKARKQANKAAKAAREQALTKNANNNGEITAGEEQSSVHGDHDASDVNAVPGGGHVAGEYKNKKAKKAKKSQTADVTALTKQVEGLSSVVEKALSQPRFGGPVLDGISRGAQASEGRLGDTVTKSEDGSKIEELRKSLDAAENPYQREQISRELTLAQLRLGHETGAI